MIDRTYREVTVPAFVPRHPADERPGECERAFARIPGNHPVVRFEEATADELVRQARWLEHGAREMKMEARKCRRAAEQRR